MTEKYSIEWFQAQVRGFLQRSVYEEEARHGGTTSCRINAIKALAFELGALAGSVDWRHDDLTPMGLQETERWHREVFDDIVKIVDEAYRRELTNREGQA